MHSTMVKSDNKFPVDTVTSFMPIPNSVPSFSSNNQYENDDDIMNMLDDQDDNTSLNIITDMNDDNDNDYESGIDNEFLDELFHIVETDNYKNEESMLLETIGMNTEDDNIIPQAHHGVVSPAMSSRSTYRNTISSMEGHSSATTTTAAATANTTTTTQLLPSLQAPLASQYGFVNCYLVVDPVTQIVFCPKQIISCKIGNEVQTCEFGPFYLPNIDKSVMTNFTNHISMIPRQHQQQDPSSCASSSQQMIVPDEQTSSSSSSATLISSSSSSLALSSSLPETMTT